MEKSDSTEEKTINLNKNISFEKEGYIEAIKASFWRIWKNRFIWIWGIFLPSEWLFNNFFSRRDSVNNTSKDQWERILSFYQNYWLIIWLAILLALLLLFLWWWVTAIARGGVIQVLDRLQNKRISRTFSFGQIWRLGKSRAFSILRLDLLLLGFIFGILSVLLIPIIILAKNEQAASGLILLVILAMLISFPIFFLAYFIIHIGPIYLSLVENSVIKAIEKSYFLVIRNPMESFKAFWATFIVVCIGFFAIIVWVVAVFLAIGLAVLIYHFWGESSKNFFIAVVIIAIGIPAVGFFVWIKVFFSLWIQDIWLWWVKRVGGIKIEEKAEEVTKEEKATASVGEPKTAPGA